VGLKPCFLPKGACLVDTERNRRGREKEQIIGFLGLGLDNTDGEHRVSESEHFLLLGGSPETHERMQDTAIRFAQALKRRNKTLQDASAKEVLDLFHEAGE
jgi:hypothetical protein